METFQIGDLVWAKVKGFPPWPAEIFDPPDRPKRAKNNYYVYFFGCHMYGWVSPENIQLHKKSMLEKYESKKLPKNLKRAIQALIDTHNDRTKMRTEEELVDDSSLLENGDAGGNENIHLDKHELSLPNQNFVKGSDESTVRDVRIVVKKLSNSTISKYCKRRLADSEKDSFDTPSKKQKILVRIDINKIRNDFGSDKKESKGGQFENGVLPSSKKNEKPAHLNDGKHELIQPKLNQFIHNPIPVTSSSSQLKKKLSVPRSPGKSPSTSEQVKPKMPSSSSKLPSMNCPADKIPTLSASTLPSTSHSVEHKMPVSSSSEFSLSQKKLKPNLSLNSSNKVPSMIRKVEHNMNPTLPSRKPQPSSCQIGKKYLQNTQEKAVPCNNFALAQDSSGKPLNQNEDLNSFREYLALKKINLGATSKKPQSSSCRVDQDVPVLSGNKLALCVAKDSSGEKKKSENLSKAREYFASLRKNPSEFLTNFPIPDRPEDPSVDFNLCDLRVKSICASEKRIGFMGLGRIGQRIARNLILSNHNVTVWNRTSSQCEPFVGAKIALTPAELVESCDIIFSCFSDSDVSKNIFFLKPGGILSGFKACVSVKKGYVEFTSLNAELAKRFSDEIHHAGGRFLEAPLCGSKEDADKSNMLVMASGDLSLFKDCKSCFEAISKTPVFVSNVSGYASNYAIVRNMIKASFNSVIAEALGLIEKIGLDKKMFLELMQNDSFLNFDPSVYDVFEDSPSDGGSKRSVNTPLKFMLNSIKDALNLANLMEFPMHVTAACSEVYKRGMALKYANHDFTSLCTVVKKGSNS